MNILHEWCINSIILSRCQYIHSYTDKIYHSQTATVCFSQKYTVIQRNQTVHRQYKPLLWNWSRIWIRNSTVNPDSDPYVRQIAPKMLWIHYLVGLIVSHFTKCCENGPVTVLKMLIHCVSKNVPSLTGYSFNTHPPTFTIFFVCYQH